MQNLLPYLLYPFVDLHVPTPKIPVPLLAMASFPLLAFVMLFLTQLLLLIMVVMPVLHIRAHIGLIW
jgi:uncharacterized membrane protein YwaF